MRTLLALAAFLVLPGLASAQAPAEPAPADAAPERSCHCKEKMADRMGGGMGMGMEGHAAHGAAQDAAAQDVVDALRSGEPAQGKGCGMMGGKHGGQDAPAGEGEVEGGHEGHGAPAPGPAPAASSGHEGHTAPTPTADPHAGHDMAPTPQADAEASQAPSSDEGHTCCCKGKMGEDAAAAGHSGHGGR